MKNTESFLLKNLRTLREKSGLNQDEVAEAIGVVEKTYARYERGEYEPSEEMKSKLAKLFKVSLSDLYRDPSSKPNSITQSRAEILTEIYSLAPTLQEDQLKEILMKMRSYSK